MTAEIKNGVLTLKAPIKTGLDAPISKQGRSRIALSTNGWIFLYDESGKAYRLSLNLVTSLNPKGEKK